MQQKRVEGDRRRWYYFIGIRDRINVFFVFFFEKGNYVFGRKYLNNCKALLSCFIQDL
jgi:hypothetical protein